MKYKNLYIAIVIIGLFWLGSSYLYQGQEESRAFYAKGHLVKRHR